MTTPLKHYTLDYPPSSKVTDFLSHLPLWRGFNLQEKFTHTPEEWFRTPIEPEWGRNNERFLEKDFAMIAELGFNFVRIPMSYKCWSKESDPRHFLENHLLEIDQAVQWAKSYGLHISLNFHRAPGYCINHNSWEINRLWDSEEWIELCCLHWATFARRYKGLPNNELSFDLINEPSAVDESRYANVVRALCNAIWKEDPDRLIVSNGIDCGTRPVFEIAEIPLLQSARGYDPGPFSHHLATWAGSPTLPPKWPFVFENGERWDIEKLRESRIVPWKKLEAQGVRVHVGEWGCYHKTPHDATLAWMEDSLKLWKEAGWGWGLWCFRGSFGILDSQRADVKYENFHGHSLDRKMLTLLQNF